MSHKRRRALAALLPLFTLLPTLAAAQDQCRTIRAMTNMDGRRFADLRLGVATNPYRIVVGRNAAEGLPTPEDCDLAADAEEVSLHCHWRPSGGYAGATALFDSLLDRFRQCLARPLTPPVGPRPYGNATALRQSETGLPVPGGETRISLSLIEAPDTPQYRGYHYLTLGVTFSVAEEAEAD